MAQEGYARVRAHFTFERMVADTAALYARIVRRPHKADEDLIRGSA